MSYLKNSMCKLTLKPSDTAISNITTNESIDVVALDKLLSSDLLRKTFNNKLMGKIYNTEYDQLIKFKALINKEKTATILHKKKGMGRSNPKLGLFLIRREIRQTLVKDIYVDIDMENAHVVMLQQICAKNNIPTPNLDDYVNHREAHLKAVMEKYKCNRDDAKRVFLVAMYCGNFIIEGEEPDFYKALVKETRGIAQIVASSNPDIAAFVEDKNNATKYEYVSNKNGKVMSHFLQEIEHQCLNEMFLYCTQKGYIVNNNCSLQADGIMIPAINYDEKILKNLNKHIKKTIGLNITFTQKVMKDDYLTILDEHQVKCITPIVKKELPKLERIPQITGHDKFLSNIFTKEMYDDNETIVLQSCCGTGKTYSVAKYITESKDKVISIINRKSLLTAQIKEFNNRNVNLGNYEDKNAYDLDENGIICVNSIMKYSRKPDEHFKQFVVYIDECNSFLETLTHSQILTKDIKIVYETLIRIIKNCKKLIVSDHTITEAVFNFFKNRKTKSAPFYVKNNFMKFKGVKAYEVKDETRFKDAIEAKMNENEGFFAGFDSATVATQYFHNLKGKTKLECILVTDETKVKIPNDMSVWEGKCIFYSPKIETGVDFNVDTKQSVFFHMKGQTILPTSAFQMIARTRNMKDLTWYAKPSVSRDLAYKSFEHVKEEALIHKERTNLHMCSSYLDHEDNLTFSPNSFYDIYLFNEYVRDIFENDKQAHLKSLLFDNGFVCIEDCTELPRTMSKVMISDMKDMTDEAINLIFEQWINKEIINENYDIRSYTLKLLTDDEKKQHSNLITNKNDYNDHLKLIMLLKDSNYIKDRAHEVVKNSYFEFGIDNIFSKIKLLSEFEHQTNIKRFDFSEVKAGGLSCTTWEMIKKIFNKKSILPTDTKQITIEYVGLINNIVKKMYTGKRIGDNKANVRVYTFDTERFNDSYMLDQKTNVNGTSYDLDLVDRLGFAPPAPVNDDDDYELLVVNDLIN
jgi:hypothetical protein